MQTSKRKIADTSSYATIYRSLHMRIIFEGDLLGSHQHETSKINGINLVWL